MLAGFIGLLVYLFPRSNEQRSLAAPTASATVVSLVSRGTASATPPRSPGTGLPTATIQTSAMPDRAITPGGVPITPGGPLPSSTPSASATAPSTATPTGNASLLVARDVDGSGNPVKPGTAFAYPSMRLYGIAQVHSVSSQDVLRFVFERNHVILPQDVISYTAGGDAASHTFSAYADYANGTRSLPRGQYQLLFYRNGKLEAAAAFTIG